LLPGAGETAGFSVVYPLEGLTMKKPKDDRESLRALVRELYYWAAHMGGWESPVWDKVDALKNAWDKEDERLAKWKAVRQVVV
jgi:hypothetical protein